MFFNSPGTLGHIFDVITMSSRIFVGHLPREVDSRDIEDYFDRMGRIRDVVHKGNYAFVEFNDERDARDAISELNGE